MARNKKQQFYYRFNYDGVKKKMIVKKANNCYIESTDGAKLIDTTMGSGAQIIGHNNSLIKKISEQIKNGTIYTVPNCHTEKVNYYLKKPDLINEQLKQVNKTIDELRSSTSSSKEASNILLSYLG